MVGVRRRGVGVRERWGECGWAKCGGRRVYEGGHTVRTMVRHKSGKLGLRLKGAEGHHTFQFWATYVREEGSRLGAEQGTAQSNSAPGCGLVSVRAPY